MKTLLLNLALGLFCFTACTSPEQKVAIIPCPNHIESGRGTFQIKGKPMACDLRTDERTQRAVGDFAAQLAAISGGDSPVTVAEQIPDSGIRFIVDQALSDEGYVLTIEKNGIEVRAAKFAGFLYAIQSLKQLLPVEIYGTTPAHDAPWEAPCLSITDSPRFRYRAMHMDVARHFFEVEEVKRYLDVMALHKLNTLHWHLTDDQGWRIEIKRYPELALKGGFRNGTVVRKNWDEDDGIRYGGFYTQDQIREVVEYAAQKGITIIPEIDLPGHMLAALTAYPELGCTGGPYAVWNRWGVADEVLCAGNEKIYPFLEGVLTEVMELFPSQYIHIGGDECPKVRWEQCPKCQARIASLGLKDTEEFTAEHYLQSYVMSRIEKFLEQHDRRIIGWDEIMEGELSPDATVMSWRGSNYGIMAAKQGRDVIMVPTAPFYFDYYQSPDVENEPFGIGGYNPIERVYAFDASFQNELSPEQAAHILGVQANLWTEYIATPQHLEYMLLPRLAALSEVQWCNDATKDWTRFTNSLEHVCQIYTQMGYNFATHIFGVIGAKRVNAEKSCVELTLSTQGDAPIHYTTDGTEPTVASPRYAAPLEIRQGCTVKAMVDRPTMQTRMYQISFTGSKSLGKPATLVSSPSQKYTFDGASLLTDGILGPFSYAGGEWIGYHGTPMEVTIHMGQTEPYASLACNMLIQQSDDIFPPELLDVYTSQDNKEFTLVGTMPVPAGKPSDKDRIERYVVDFPSTSAPYVRVVAKMPAEVPAWHPGHGRKPFIFVDEIMVN